MPSPMSPPLADNLGAVFLGVIFSSILFGITNLQTYIYYSRYLKDRYTFKVFVAILWILDAFHLVLTVYSMYRYLITGFGDVLNLLTVMWTIKLQILVNIVTILIVQSLYMLRIWKLGRGHHHTFLPCLVTFIVAVAFAVGILDIVAAYRMTTWLELDTISWSIEASFATSMGVDLVIAAVMCYYLHKTKSGFTGSNGIINKLIRYTLSSGLATAACSVSALVSFMVMPTNLIFLAIEFSLTKLYINSFLAMLNTRKHIREATGDSLSIRLSKWRSADFPAGGPPSPSASFVSPSSPVMSKCQTILKSPTESNHDARNVLFNPDTHVTRSSQFSPRDGQTFYQWPHVDSFEPRAV